MLSPGTQLGQFEIVGHLGSGGMGEVYRARDTKLGREVAIKVLPEGFAKDGDRLTRFQREAKVLASLDHPNIGALYDFQTATPDKNIPRPSGPPPSKGDFSESATQSSPPSKGDQGGCSEIHFLVLQLVEGETLGDRIDKGPIPVKEALPLFIQMAEALEAAHEQGIIHRDLKPDNVKVSLDGKVKVLDFGMAKSVAPVRTSSPTADTKISGTDPTKVTTDGMILGTPSYMSPEQARGLEVDKKTDIWAFGCCLYEALTGEIPFPGGTVSDTIAAVLEHEPDWDKLPEGLPPQVDSLLRRCLAKEPPRRLSGAGDVAVTLEEAGESLKRDSQKLQATTRRRPEGRAGVRIWVKAGAVVAAMVLVGMLGYFLREPGGTGPSSTEPAQQAITSLAVLPFENQSGDASQEYFVDGMTGALTSELSKISSIKVIGRASAMHYKGTDKSPREIAEELHVDALITGSALQLDNEVTITAELMHAATQTTLWSNNYTNIMENVLKLHSQVALDIAGEIRVTLTPEEEASYAAAKGVNPAAYDLYLQARTTMQARSEESLRSAMSLFEGATALDGSFALAYAGLADCYSLLATYGLVAPAEAREPAERFAARAISLGADSSEAHASMGFTLFKFSSRWDEMDREFRRAIELNPGSDQARLWYGSILSFIGRTSDALDQMKRAVEMNPLSPLHRANLAEALYFARDFDQASEHVAEAIKLDPNHPYPLMVRWRILTITGRYTEAVESIAHVGGPMIAFLVAVAKAYAGDSEPAHSILSDIDSGATNWNLLSPRDLLGLHAALGDVDTALTWMERAADFEALKLKTDPLFDPLRDDPRYWEFIEKLNFPPLPPEHPLYEKEQEWRIQKKAEELLADRPKPVRRYSINLDPAFPMAASAGGLPEFFAVSLNGDTIYYVTDAGGERKIMARAMSRFESVPIRGTEGASGISLSPDGSRLAFSANNAVWTLPVDGGTPQRANGVLPITGSPGAVLPSVWVGDNSLALFSLPGTTFRAFNVDTETTRELSQTPSPAIVAPLSFDHNNQLLFLTTAPPNFVSYILDLNSGELKLLAEGDLAISIPTGGVALGRFEGNSISVKVSAFDASRRELTGRPISLFEGTRFPDIGGMAFSQNGHLFCPVLPSQITALNVEDLKHDLMWVEMDGTETPLGVRPLPYRKVRVFGSGSEQRIAVDLEDRSYIWIVESDGSLNRFTFGFPMNGSPMWSPDGTEIFFLAVQDPRVESLASLYRKPSDLSQEPKKIPLPGIATPYDWTPDGASLIAVHESATDDRFSMSTIHVTDDGRLETLVSSDDHGFFAPALSPNGRWIAYGSNETDPPNIFVRSWPDLRVVGQISEDGGREPMWSADGSALFFRGPTHMMETPIRPTGTFAWDAPRELFEDDYLRIEGLGNPRSYDYDPVANRFLMVKEPQTSGPTEIIVIENWAEDIKTRFARIREAN